MARRRLLSALGPHPAGWAHLVRLLGLGKTGSRAAHVPGSRGSTLIGLLPGGRGRRRAGADGAAAEALLAAADLLRDRGECRQAAAAYAEAVALLPHRTDLRVQLGNMLKDSGQLAEAAAAYGEALTQAPRDADIHLQLGHALKLQGELEAAAQAYAQAAALGRSSADAERELALLRAPTEPAPDPAPAPDFEAALAGADALRDAGQASAAAEVYRRALALAPHRTDLLIQLGNMLKDAGRYADALATYGLAATARPGDADLWLQYGRAFEFAAQTEQAIAAYQTALQLDPSLDDAASDLYRILPIDPSRPKDLRSKLEKRDPIEVAGWVFEASRPDRPADISVAIDGVFYRSLRAELRRGDLTRIAPNLVGGGFALSLPPGQDSVEVSLHAHGEHLRGSPFRIALEPRPVALPPHYAKAGGLAPTDGPASTDVAIIVPVFNAPAETERCLEALLEHTTWPARLIIIDDGSTDPAISALLDPFHGKPSVTLVRNATNLGYTRTVNLGISLAGRSDVVILNSDTAVGPRWLDQLRCAARSAPDIASVTAVSDNAGAFTLPDADRPTPLPPGFAMEDMQRLAAQHAGRHWPDVPTANGFCVYLRRAALDALGGFDEQAFPRGYGEENDWSMRAARLGWRHIIDDRTFVHHERSASFGSARASLVADGQKVLLERYPEYNALVRGMQSNARLLDARRRMRAALVQNQPRPRPRVLFVISTQTGGTPLTNRDLMAALSNDYEPLLLTCDARVITLSRPACSDGEHDIPLARHVLSEPLSLASHHSLDYDTILTRWLTDFAVELLHIRHLAWHGLNLPAVAQGLGIPVLLSFHDFYSVCPTVKLLDSDGTFCAGTCTQGARDCTPELWDPIHAPPIKHAYIHTWRDKFRRAFESCDAFVTTSERTRTTILKVYPELAERRFLVVPHGRDFVAFCPPRAAPPELKTLTILVPGNISPAKGRDVIAALAEIDQGRRLQFHLMGEVSPPLTGPGIHNHGRYSRETFAGLATKLNPDIGAVFSIWPETYCHTLTELWAIGLPVAGFDLGAIGERIRGTGAGWLLPQGDIAELYGQLTQIGRDGPGRQRAADCVAAWQAGEGQAWTCSAMASRYKDIFGRLVTERRAFTSAPQPPPDP